MIPSPPPTKSNLQVQFLQRGDVGRSREESYPLGNHAVSGGELVGSDRGEGRSGDDRGFGFKSTGSGGEMLFSSLLDARLGEGRHHQVDDDQQRNKTNSDFGFDIIL